MTQIHKKTMQWDTIDPIILDTLCEYDIALIKKMPKRNRDYFLMQVSDLMCQEKFSDNNENIRERFTFLDEEKSLNDLLYDRMLNISEKVFQYYN